MNKRLTSLLVAALMIFSMAAVASADCVLSVTVPEGKTLKAFSIKLKGADVTVEGLGDFTVTSGKNKVNGFSIDGATGDVDIAKITGNCDSVDVDECTFGASADDQFKVKYKFK